MWAALATGFAASAVAACFGDGAWSEEAFGLCVDEPRVSFEVPAVVDCEGLDGDRAVVWVETGAIPVGRFELVEERDEPGPEGVDGGDITTDGW